MTGPAAAHPGYRRRILIEPAPGTVTAELEDDYHRMVVTLSHDGGIVTAVESAMKRSPWTTCPGAIAQLERTFLGKPLAETVAREEKVRNCTHLFDLATFAAGHADETAPVAYDVEVSDPVDGRNTARLSRNGAPLLDWTMEKGRFVAPSDMAGLDMRDIGRWIAGQAADMQEPAKVLRWATMIGLGRSLDIPAGIDATRFASGACFTFQPDIAEIAARRPGADIDFFRIGAPPLADRDEAFAPAR